MMTETIEAPVAAPPKAIDKIAQALAKAQSEITSPPRNREVTVKTKTGGSYKFKYATLDSIIDHVRAPLTRNGIWFIQTLESDGGGRYRLVTTLTHESGQYITSETPLLVGGAGNQEFGSALTYMRRYALTALLGIAADEDDDANRADGNTIEQSRERTTSRTAQRGASKPADERHPAREGHTVADDMMKAINAAESVARINAIIGHQKWREQFPQLPADQQKRISELVERRMHALAQQPTEHDKKEQAA